ncbi:MAG: acylneuraminate cytidylyltransferase family protein, partial [Myxococcales bacterium]|nr:acylneuraminate cytidylyltransferase family protein [Myxococcales bacterium]
MRVLGLIPARGGSKGVPRKNVRLLGGKALIGYTIEAALQARRVDRVLVSTEDAEIASVSKNFGSEVPFLRPASLAQDDSPMLPVITHAIEAVSAEGWVPDVLCLLQPTFPFRRPEEIDACIEALEAQAADCVISVHRVPAHFNPHWVYFERPDGSLQLSTGESEPIPRRQALPPAFYRSGAVYVSRAAAITKRGSLYGDRVVGYETPAESSCNIDTM